MAKSEIKAGFFTVLLFGGALWFLFGKPGLEELKGMLPDSKEKTTKTASKKKSSRSSSDVATGKVIDQHKGVKVYYNGCLLYTSPSPRDGLLSRMPSSA